ncbi:MAG TPA: SRPBCC domain-containing protein [Magnetospirillum sp.]|nr:SRPBCC domain-containing protein [Magnetospirillum sp.]
MNVSGEFRVPTARETVWRALHDPDTLRVCIPGCEDVQAIGDHQFAGRMMARVGAVSTVFTGHLIVSDETFPKGWQVSAHAESPTAGWADGTANVRLAAVSGGTLVTYRIHLDPGGRLASVGDRLLRGVAMRMANDFFTRLTEHLMPEPPAAGPEAQIPQDRSDPNATPPRRMVLPLAPTATAPPVRSGAAEPNAAEPPSRAQRIIILVGWIYCAFILFSMGLALIRQLRM